MSPTTGRTLVAAEGLDGHVNYRVQPSGGSWGPWTWTTGTVSSAPSRVAVGGLFTMFARGADNSLLVRSEYRPDGWGDWHRIGGVLNSAPSAVTGGGTLPSLSAWGDAPVGA